MLFLVLFWRGRGLKKPYFFFGKTRQHLRYRFLLDVYTALFRFFFSLRCCLVLFWRRPGEAFSGIGSCIYPNIPSRVPYHVLPPTRPPCSAVAVLLRVADADKHSHKHWVRHGGAAFLHFLLHFLEWRRSIGVFPHPFVFGPLPTILAWLGLSSDLSPATNRYPGTWDETKGMMDSLAVSFFLGLLYTFVLGL